METTTTYTMTEINFDVPTLARIAHGWTNPNRVNKSANPKHEMTHCWRQYGELARTMLIRNARAMGGDWR
jgi:hypothetical protein